MKYQFYMPIAVLFAATLLICNTIAGKIFVLGGQPFSVAIVIFPLSYLFGDILTEVYGYAASRRIIWAGFAAELLMVACYEVGKALPPADFWPNQAAYEAILGVVPRVVLTS